MGSGQENRLSGFVLRDYRVEDFDVLWRLDQICFTRGIAYSKEELAHFFSQKKSFSMVAETAGEPRGFIVVEHNGRDTGRVITIDVHPDAQRSGLGSLMMQAAEGRLSALGLGRMVLEVAVDNLPAISFYKRHGYSVVKTIPRYYLGSLDALRMEKRI